eukprot:m.309708 g.309708  ORF g.309708 m.309708 type:complete len:294 (-) comp15946_c0_seq26:2045-2926(-)
MLAGAKVPPGEASNLARAQQRVLQLKGQLNSYVNNPAKKERRVPGMQGIVVLAHTPGQPVHFEARQKAMKMSVIGTQAEKSVFTFEAISLVDGSLVNVKLASISDTIALLGGLNEALAQILAAPVGDKVAQLMLLSQLAAVNETCDDVEQRLEAFEQALNEAGKDNDHATTFEQAKQDAMALNSLARKYPEMQEGLHPAEQESDWGRRYGQYTHYTLQQLRLMTDKTSQQLMQAFSSMLSQFASSDAYYYESGIQQTFTAQPTWHQSTFGDIKPNRCTATTHNSSPCLSKRSL